MNENLNNEESYGNEEELYQNNASNVNQPTNRTNKSKSTPIRNYIREPRNNKTNDKKNNNKTNNTRNNMQNTGFPRRLANRVNRNNGKPFSPNNKQENNFPKKRSNTFFNRIPNQSDQNKQNETINENNKANIENNKTALENNRNTILNNFLYTKQQRKQLQKAVKQKVKIRIFLKILPYLLLILAILLILFIILYFSHSVLGILNDLSATKSITNGDMEVEELFPGDTNQAEFNEKILDYYEEYKSCGTEIDINLIMSTLNYGNNLSRVYEDEADTTYEEDAIDETENATEETMSDAELKERKKRLKKLVRNQISGSCTLDLEKYDEYLLEEYIPEYLSDYFVEGEREEESKERILNDIHMQANSFHFWFEEDEDYCITSTGTDCSYTINGQTVSNIKVELINCNATSKSNSEVLLTLDFEDYIKGVVYAETDGYPIEAQKAQAVAARSFALTRQNAMCPGNPDDCFVGYNSSTNTIRMRACENDQVYCDWRNGCSRNGSGNVTTYTQGTPGWKSGMSGDELTQFEAAMDEVAGQVLVDSNNEIYYTNYTQGSGQNQWRDTVNAGGDYYEALLGYYGTDKDVISNCQQSSTQVAIGVAGSTHMPILEYTRISQNYSGGHDGIDYAAPEGTSIYAIADGVVDRAQDLTYSYGKWVRIRHDIDGDGNVDYYTIYAHMSERLVNEGDTVNGGQEIGKVGSTGNSSGNHLHFEMRDGNNNVIDPNPILESIQSGTSNLGNSSTSEISESTRAAEDIYYNQHDYTQAYCGDMLRTYSGCSHSEQATISTSGCAVTSLAMVAATLNNDTNITPSSVGSWVCDNTNYRTEMNGTSWRLFHDETMQENLGIKTNVIWDNSMSSKPSSDEIMSTIIEKLQNGDMIIASLKDDRLDYHRITEHGEEDPGNNIWGTKGGHFVVLSSINEEGQIKVLDSANENKTGYYSQEDIRTNYVGAINSGIWSFSGTGSNNQRNANVCVTSNYSQAGDYATWKQGSYVPGANTPWENIHLGSSKATIRSAGCTATSVAIQIARSGTQLTVSPFDPGVFVETLNANGGFTSGGYITWTGWQSIAPNWVYDGKEYFSGSESSKANQISELINDNKYLVACVKGVGAIACGHWVAIDRVENGKIYMFDPSSNETVVTEKYSIFGLTQAAVFHKND